MLPQIRNVLFILLGVTFLVLVLSILFWTGIGLTHLEFMEDTRGIHHDMPVVGSVFAVFLGLSFWVAGAALVSAVVLYVIPFCRTVGEILWTTIPVVKKP